MAAPRLTTNLTMGNRIVFNFVTVPPNCFDVFGRLKAVPHFFPKMADVDGNGVVAFGEIFVLPDLVEQLFCTDHLASVLTEDHQNGKFRRGQGQRPLVQGALMGSGVDGQTTQFNELLGRGRGVVSLVPPQLGFNSGHQLQGPEGFGDVVVCA